MAGRDLSKTQRGIVNRYYQNRDGIMVQKLGEIVSEIALADSEKKAERLWKRAETALANTDVKPAKAAEVIASRDVSALAKLLEGLL